MSERDAYIKRYQDGIFNYRQICGEDPTICVMGYDDFIIFEALCKQECTIVMKEGEPEFGKRQWLGIDIFEGDTAVGMRFGR